MPTEPDEDDLCPQCGGWKSEERPAPFPRLYLQHPCHGIGQHGYDWPCLYTHRVDKGGIDIEYINAETVAPLLAAATDLTTYCMSLLNRISFRQGGELAQVDIRDLASYTKHAMDALKSINIRE